MNGYDDGRLLGQQPLLKLFDTATYAAANTVKNYHHAITAAHNSLAHEWRHPQAPELFALRFVFNVHNGAFFFEPNVSEAQTAAAAAN